MPGILERLGRCAHREDDEVVDLALLLRLHPLIGIEAAVGAVAARDLTGDLGREIGNLECLDPARAALALDQALPRRIDAARQRGDHSESCDDHTPHRRFLDQGQHYSPLTLQRAKIINSQINFQCCAAKAGTSAFRVLFEELDGIAHG
jgi:hypothetical protein